MIASRGLVAVAAALLGWQNPTRDFGSSATVEAAPARFATERTIVPNGAGQACAVLDAAAFAGTKGELGAMRLYRAGGGEVPFAVTESGEAGQQTEAAGVRNLGERSGRIVFDLAMPPRAYTSVTLSLAAQDFYAVADVSGLAREGAKPVHLGQFALFDLHTQGLARNTTLPLQEETFPLLHIELQMTAAPGARSPAFPSAIVAAATVPPSRSAQTLYTTVAQTSVFTQKDNASIATLAVSAHVPVERVRFQLRNDDRREFLRTVRVSAKATGSTDPEDAVESEIERVHRTGTGGQPIDSERLFVDAVIAANLRSAATLDVAVENGDDTPLALQSVELAMRERRLCFVAEPATAYTLFYGAPAVIRAPSYDFARLFNPSRTVASATLQAETPNPIFRIEVPHLTYLQRHPELLWVALLAAIGVLGSVALRGANRIR